MSGGSYSYLYSKDIDELIHIQDEIQTMADDLSRLGYASDAALDTLAFLNFLRYDLARLAVMKERLSVVWKAMEWWQSCDTDEADFKQALNLYRGV